MWRIEVSLLPEFTDSAGNGALSDIKEDLLIKSVESVKFVDVYLLEAKLDEKKVKEIAEKLLIDPITQEFKINSEFFRGFDWAIEVSLHKNVTDNVGMTAEEGIEDIIGKKFEGSVRTARKYLLKGNLKEDEVKRICTDLLANEIIENYSYKKLD
ncbi:MAG: phosphoribosylformylglycinamidine synthase subunit PurS [Candidatus Diapherotrites archaeon]